MDQNAKQLLTHLLRHVRTAALGTLRDGEPAVAMVLFATMSDASLVLHISRLGRHTQDLLRDPRVSLLVAEPDTPARNPQNLARVMIQAFAETIAPGDPGHDVAQVAYLDKYPGAAVTFTLGDFLLVRLRPQRARLVAGFAQAHDLTPDDLAAALGG